MNPRLTKRVVIAKFLGLILTALSLLLVHFMFDIALAGHMILGLLFWGSTLGALIGLSGVMIKHPLFKLPLPAWLRGMMVGFAFSLLLILLAWPTLVAAMSATLFTSPFWILIDGMILGLIIDVIATRYAGQGRLLVSMS